MTRASSGSFDAVAIGGSAGSVEILLGLLSGLPETFPASVLVCIHSAPGTSAALAQLLSHRGGMPAHEASDKEKIEAGQIYVAPGGYHLLVERDRTLNLSVDPPVHFSRPSIDVLFESAAYCYANRLLAFTLSGANADGALGSACVKRNGGILVVQHPASAIEAAMPEAALAAVAPDAMLDPAAMRALLVRLAEGTGGWPI